MDQCLICHTTIEPFISFGKMPIANGFLLPAQFEQEVFFDLKVGYCSECHMVQLTETIDPLKLFHEAYAFYSSTSTYMQRHFTAFAEMVRAQYLTAEDSLVVEIGSNDGIMLQNFMIAGIRHIGVEPSANVAQVAIEKGINTVGRFFNEETSADLRREYGPAHAILGANVMCHLPNIHSVLRGIDHLLTEEGVFIFEDPYLGDIISKTSYDQIYDEHVFYFSLHSLQNLFTHYKMEIVDIAPQEVHGGSMRYVIGRKGQHQVSSAVSDQWQQEETMGLNQAETFTAFAKRIDESRNQLVDLLNDLKRQDKRVVGYGATSKSTTVTNYCNIGPELVEFICDTTPFKQDKYSPGAHIPVVPYARFSEDYPDVALLFAWNHKREILEKEQDFIKQGGEFIVYVPKVQQISQ